MVKSLWELARKSFFRHLTKHSILRPELVYHWQLRNKAHELFFNVICKYLPFQIKVKLWGFFLHKNMFINTTYDHVERLMIERLSVTIELLPYAATGNYEEVCVFCHSDNDTRQYLCTRCLRNLTKPKPTFLCWESGVHLIKEETISDATSGGTGNSDDLYRKKMKIEDDDDQKYYEQQLSETDLNIFFCRSLMEKYSTSCSSITSSVNFSDN